MKADARRVLVCAHLRQAIRRWRARPSVGLGRWLAVVGLRVAPRSALAGACTWVVWAAFGRVLQDVSPWRNIALWASYADLSAEGSADAWRWLFGWPLVAAADGLLWVLLAFTAQPWITAGLCAAIVLIVAGAAAWRPEGA